MSKYGQLGNMHEHQTCSILPANAFGHHIILSDRAGGVQIQRHVELLRADQSISTVRQPHGQTRAQLVRLTAGLVAQFRHAPLQMSSDIYSMYMLLFILSLSK